MQQDSLYHNKKKKLIILNGPPKSGKDYTANFISTHLNAEKVKLAKFLKEKAHALIGKPHLPHDHYELLKDIPIADFENKTPREFYIALSENFYKPLYGKDYFARQLFQYIKNSSNNLFICSDGGCQEEIDYLEKQLGSDCLMLINISRKNCDFNSDSRSYINLNNKENQIFIINTEKNFDKLLELILLPIIKKWCFS